MAKDIVWENSVAEKGAFRFTVSKVEEVMEVPFVYGPNNRQGSRHSSQT